MANKTTLRQHFSTLRKQVTLDVHLRLNQQLTTLVPKIFGFLSEDDYLAIYHPFGHEASPMALASCGLKLALPRVAAKNTPLIFHPWQPDDCLTKGYGGIMEPSTNLPTIIPRIIITPLLAYDDAGTRLGYGGGFYDATLNHLRGRSKQQHPILAIGLAYSCQYSDTLLPKTPYDATLDGIITESGYQSFSKAL